MLAESPVRIGPGGDILNGCIYFGSGSHLYSYRIPGWKAPRKHIPEQKQSGEWAARVLPGLLLVTPSFHLDARRGDDDHVSAAPRPGPGQSGR